MSDGWQCPGCGRCYSPCICECSRCGQPGVTVTTDNVTFEIGTCQCEYPSVVHLTDGKRCAGCWKRLANDPPGWSLTTTGST